MNAASHVVICFKLRHLSPFIFGPFAKINAASHVVICFKFIHFLPFIFGPFTKINAAKSFVMSVLPSACNNSAPTGHMFVNLILIRRKSAQKFQLSLISGKYKPYFAGPSGRAV